MSTVTGIAIISAVFFFVVQQCGALGVDSELSSERLVGGQLALPGRFSYQVAVFGPDKNTSDSGVAFICSGAIISNRWILTAAFCTHNQQPSELYVLAGAVNLTQGGERVDVARIIIHPDWTGRHLANNVALLQLSRTLTWGRFIRAIGLRSRFVGNHVRALVSGWGQTEAGKITTNLKYTQVYTLTNDQCRERWGTHSHIIFNTTLCAALRRGVGICYGDAGTPLVANNRLIGLGSRVFNPCGSDKPDLYSRLSEYLGWILNNTDIELS